MIVAVVAAVITTQPLIMNAQHQIDCVASETVRVWTPIKPAVVQTRVEPSWTSYMGQSDVKGVVLMDVWIDESGRVTCVRVTRSIPILDAAIVTAVHQWKFAPATMGDKPVAVVQQVGVRFPPVK
jgi:TonB family protein